MSKAFKAASSIGAAMVVLAGSVSAAAPNLSEWTVSSGIVSTNLACFSGYTCGNAITGVGFFQRQVTDDLTGEDYFQTIITDTGATGSAGDVNISFSDESFVAMGNSNGIKDKSYINSIDTNNGTVFEAFYATTELNTGWAAPSGGDQTKIWQAVEADMDALNGNDFRTDFWFDQLATGTTVNSRLMRISEYVDIEKSSGSSQDFVLVDKLGADFTVAGSVAGFVLSDGSTSNLSWANGDNIQAVWLGQDLSQMGDVYQSFGFTSYNNVDNADPKLEGFSLSPGSYSAPQLWNTSAPSAGWGAFTGSETGSGGPFP